MPNYGLVVTPTYNPMSYEQYIQPFKDYAQVYNATVDQIDALEMEANQWERLADSDIDAPQYQQYKSYADDLRKYANEIATQGLSSRTRAGLSRMRQRYAKEIKPIEEAFNYRQKMAEEQRKLNPKGDMQWDVDFSNIGLGTVMANPSMGYSGRSLSEMEQEGFEQAKALSTRRLSEPARAMSGQYFLIRQGFSADEANKWLSDRALENPQAASEVSQYIDDIYQQVRKSYGTDGTDSRYSASQNLNADKRITSGILKGLVLQDSYQANRGWEYEGANGGGKTTPELQDIGYEVTLPREAEDGTKYVDRYTVVDEGGKKIYYDQNGNIITDNKLLTELEKESPKVRYYLRPHNNNADVVDVVDKLTGMVVTQDNGEQATYNRTKQRWDSKTHRVVDLPSKDKANKRTSNRIFISSGSTKKWVDKIEDAYKALKGSWYETSFAKRETSTATVKDLIDNYTLTENEKKLLEEHKYESDMLNGPTKEAWKKAFKKKGIYEKIIENLPPDAKKDPENYLIQYENGGDYQFITFPQKNYTVNENGQLVNVPQQEPDFNANGLGG